LWRLKVGIESKTTQLSNQCKRHPGTPGRHFVTWFTYIYIMYMI
jgi:hypothetical protein